MSLNTAMFLQRKKIGSEQSGFLLPLAAFIIVGLSFLALAIARISSQSGTSFYQEAISLQAFYAAETGAQSGMAALFFPVADRATADAACTAINGSALPAFTADGLRNCSVTLNCSQSTDAGSTTSFYAVTSFATCGSGDLNAERSIAVTAFIQ